MKSTVKVLTWAMVITGLFTLPLLLRRRAEMIAKRVINIRYDNSDYLSEAESQN